MRSVGFGSRAPTERPAAHEPPAADTAAGAAIRVRDGEVRLGAHVVWSGVDATVDGGEFAAILGPNGSGKTTLLRVLLGELPLASGSVSVLGARPGARKGQIGYLPQRRHFDPGTRIRGIDLVRLGLDGAPATDASRRRSRSSARARTRDARSARSRGASSSASSSRRRSSAIRDC